MGSIRKRTSHAARLLVLALLPASAPRASAVPASAAPAGVQADVAGTCFRRIVVLSDDAFELRIVHVPEASLADHRFIGFEIENKTEHPLALNASLSWDATWTRTATGERIQPSNVSSGLDDAIVARLGTSAWPSYPPGTTTFIDVPSRILRGQLGVPLEGKAARITLEARASATVRGRARIESLAEPVVVSFTWAALDEPSVAALAREAIDLLPCSLPSDGALLAKLLDGHAIATRIPKEALLRELSSQRESACTACIVRCVARHHARDPSVRALLLDALQRRRDDVLGWLWQAPELWSDEFMPLVRAMSSAPSAASLLARHAPQELTASPRVEVRPESGLSSPDGAPVAAWRTALRSLAVGPPSIAGSLVLVQTEDDGLRALSLATGEPRWTARVTTEDWALRAVTPSARLVVLAIGRRAWTQGRETELVALGLDDGRELWRVRIPDAAGIPGLVLGEVLFMPASDHSGLGSHRLVAFDVATGLQRWSSALRHPAVAPPLATKDIVAVLTTDGGHHVEARDIETGERVLLAPEPEGPPPPPGTIHIVFGDPLAPPVRSLAVTRDRFVITRWSDVVEMSAWQAGEKEPLWRARLQPARGQEPPVAAGTAIVVPPSQVGERTMQVLDGSTGDELWTSGEIPLAASESGLITISPAGWDAILEARSAKRGSSGPIRLTWRDPTTGRELGARTARVPPSCVASGLRLACAAQGEAVGLLPDDGSPPIEWSEQEATSDRLAWRQRVGERVVAMAVAQGIVGVDIGGGTITARVLATGREIWRKTMPSHPGSALRSRDGAFVIETPEAGVVALDAATGEEAWRSADGGFGVRDAATDRVDWCAEGGPWGGSRKHCDDDLLLRVDARAGIEASRIADGTPAWTTRLDDGDAGWVPGWPSRSGDLLLVGPSSGRLVALRRNDGSIAWTAMTRGVGLESLTERDGVLYLPVQDGGAGPSALDAETGEVIWHRAPMTEPSAAPAAWRELLLYPGRDGMLRAVRRDDASVAWTENLGGSLLRPLVVDALLVVGSDDGRVSVLRLER